MWYGECENLSRRRGGRDFHTRGGVPREGRSRSEKLTRRRGFFGGSGSGDRAPMVQNLRAIFVWGPRKKSSRVGGGGGGGRMVINSEYNAENLHHTRSFISKCPEKTPRRCLKIQFP